MRTGFTSYNYARYFANKELLAVVSPTKYAHPAVPTNIIKKMWSATAALFNVSPAPNSPPLSLRASPLMDAPRLTRNLESAYREMWQNHIGNTT